MNNRTQRIKINDCFSLRHEIEYDVPQRSILGPLLFNIDLIDLFPVDTGRKLNVHKTFRRRPGRLLNVLCTFNLRPVSAGFFICENDDIASYTDDATP